MTQAGIANPSLEIEEQPSKFEDLVLAGPPSRQAGLLKRIQSLLSALGVPAQRPSAASAVAALDQALAGAGLEEMWLALAVLTATLPKVGAVRRAVRTAMFEGPLPVLFEAVMESDHTGPEYLPEVEVVTGAVLVDLHHTARNLWGSGIQRVARETARRWIRDHGTIPVGWTTRYQSLRRLDGDELEAALEGTPMVGPEVQGRWLADGSPRLAHHQAVVPWRCTHLVPELAAEPERALRYQALFRFSRCSTGLISFDCVPVTMAETCAAGMSENFPLYLAAAAHADRVAAISGAAKAEYEGWRRMLAGKAQSGPEIQTVPLPVYSIESTAEDRRQARELLGVGMLPVVLTVGSHEPRKNHLAVLHAAETLWREGLLFTVTFVGANSWKSEYFTTALEALQSVNRPVQAVLGISERLLWAAYREAHCIVFPSLHEGFGLPVAESLASGTPVITTDYGSMRELAAHGGALLVDPRDDGALTDALRRLLKDRTLHARLTHEARDVPRRSWDAYAAETWDFLVDGRSV
jgi:glycosyltransferase involved in cell wall biosynthesis